MLTLKLVSVADVKKQVATTFLLGLANDGFYGSVHPYLGFTDKYVSFDEYNLIERKDDALLLGIQGGSVASNIYIEIMLKEDFFKEEMRKSLSCLKDKKFRFINLASASAKQPQSLIASSLHHKKIDLSLNIVGFNEIFNDIHPTHPLHFPWFSRVLFPKSEQMTSYLDYIRGLFYLKNKLMNMGEFSINSTEVFRVLSLKIIEKEIKKTEAKFNKKLEYRDPNLPSKYENKDDRIKYFVKLWKYFSETQRKIFENEGKVDLNFIQPAAGLTKNVIESKARNLVDDLFIKNYKYFLSHIEYDENVIDTTKFMDDYKEQVFVDYCHMTSKARTQYILKLFNELKKQESRICHSFQNKDL